MYGTSHRYCHPNGACLVRTDEYHPALVQTEDTRAELELAELLDMLARGLRQQVRGVEPLAWRPDEAHSRG